MAHSLLNIYRCAPQVSALRCFPQMTFTRNTTRDGVKKMIGGREVVGYGWNGSPVYADRVDYPMPAIRFQQDTEESKCLRKKEKGDWKRLTLAEKKRLYRFSFCQTFSEFKTTNPDWKLAVGCGFWAIAIAIMMTYMYQDLLYTNGYPITFVEERKRAQLKRMIALEVNPIDGLASKWCYHKQDWK